MSDLLLIHGGSHGAWCWDGAMRELTRMGCQGHAADLPGAGNDIPPRATVTFSSYVSAVNAFIKLRDLQDFVLFGHSLAAILIPDIVAANREAVREVVFVAAFVLEQGERAIDLIAPENGCNSW